MKRADRISNRLPIGLRTICAIAGVGLIGLVVAVLALLLGGGHHPERYPGGVDLVAAGLRWFSLWMTILGGVATAVTVRAWLTQRDRDALVAALFWTGFTICGVAILAIVLMISGPGAFSVPAPVRAVLFVGLGLLFVPPLIAGLIDAIKRGEPWRALIALLILAGLFLVGLLRRQ